MSKHFTDKGHSIYDIRFSILEWCSLKYNTSKLEKQKLKQIVLIVTGMFTNSCKCEFALYCSDFIDPTVFRNQTCDFSSDARDMGATYSLKYFFRGAIAPVNCTGALHLFCTFW